VELSLKRPEEVEMNLREALSLGDRGVISLVGGGGKSSLMYALAAELSSVGKRVLTTTTTRIYMPKPAESPAIIISADPEEIVARAAALLCDHRHLSAGAGYLAEGGKLNGLDPAAIEHIAGTGLFDFIIVEADGAAGRPLKACAPHEPVVPLFSQWIVAVVGLDAVARPLTEDRVFRSEQYSRITGLAIGEDVTEISIAAMLVHEMTALAVPGERVLRAVFLNKAETSEDLAAGKRIGGFLADSDAQLFNRVVIGELRGKPLIHYCRLLQDRRKQ
jgi:probable selenium-dependent hydroxylase accessory protein YqeC